MIEIRINVPVAEPKSKKNFKKFNLIFMKTIRKKIWPEYFDAVKSGRKRVALFPLPDKSNHKLTGSLSFKPVICVASR